ncbi:MAG: hypothetical protein JNM97_17125 [Rhodoferax sp.]|nr:hypothetical protein [Rhodoferax sp.]
MQIPNSRPALAALVIAAAVTLPAPAIAQTQASALSAISAFPIASVVLASDASGPAVEASVLLAAAGAGLVVRAIESTARGTVYVLERVSDGARVSVQVAGAAAGAASVAVGTSVTVGVIAAGTVLSVAGQVIAFVPNAVGQALLYNRRVGN